MALHFAIDHDFDNPFEGIHSFFNAKFYSFSSNTNNTPKPITDNGIPVMEFQIRWNSMERIPDHLLLINWHRFPPHSLQTHSTLSQINGMNNHSQPPQCTAIINVHVVLQPRSATIMYRVSQNWVFVMKAYCATPRKARDVFYVSF